MKSSQIKLGNTQFDFHFGLGFMGKLLEASDLGIDELMAQIGTNPFKVVPIIMHSSASYAAQRADKEFNLTVNDFIDILDDDGGIASAGVLKFLEAFTSSMTKDVPKNKTPKKQGK
jgi:hypothetical protein